MNRLLRWLLGRRVSIERERKAAEVGQLRMDSERTAEASERTVARVNRLTQPRLGSYSRVRLDRR